MKASAVFMWNYESKADVVINQGGTSSGKTYAIMQVLLMRAINEPGVKITVAGQDIPNLREGSMEDTATIINETEFIKAQVRNFNRSEKKYYFENGSWLQFKSYDNEQDAKNGKRDYLFVNEANGISYAVYEQLAVRTKKQVFIDYNPSAKFWVHDKLLPLIKDPEADIDVVRFISNYTHNKFLPETIKRRIESRRDDKEWFWVYGRGFTGKVQGLVFRKWEQAFKFPKGGNKYAFGLDWGFSNDQCAVVECCIYDKCVYAKQIIYETHLSNAELIEKLKPIVGKHPIYCDSAEPKSIAELKKAGLRVYGVKKTKDDTQFSVKKINEYDHLRVIGKDIYREVAGYAFKKNKLPDKDDHLMDATRYYILGAHGRLVGGYTIG